VTPLANTLTQAYDLEAPAGPDPLGVVHLVAGTQISGNELADQFRRRLRYVAVTAAVAFGLFAATAVFRVDMRTAAKGGLPAPYWLLAALLAGFEAAAAAGLTVRSRRRISWLALRLYELVVFAPVWLYFVYETWDTVRSAGPLQADGNTVANAVAVRWVVAVVAYGVLVPNATRRCVAVVAAVAAMPMATCLVTLAGNGSPPELVVNFAVILGVWLGVAAAVVAAGAYRVEALRREASEARKLGQYVLRERLGAGGMGEVYRAVHALLRRPCAVKLIRPERAADPTAMARFEREVQATAALAHAHVVRIFDYGRASDGTFYCVMEYLPGVTLDELVRRYGPVPPARAAFLLRQVCAALAEAHAAGLTHRDVKPGNVIARDGGRQADFATLLDFGLVLDGAGGRELGPAGTPAYMAPEQATAGPVGPAADLYAVGALGHYLLTGRPPFTGKSVADTIARVLADPAPPLPDATPPRLAAVIARCLAKSPAERYATVEELDETLVECGCGDWSHARAEGWWREASVCESADAEPPTMTFG
jgi:hypothetical protein